MKMSKVRIAEIKSMISDYVDKVGHNVIADYSESVNPKRFRWDMFWFACRYRRSLNGGVALDFYDDGINDTHLDTVLRHVMVVLNLTVRRAE